MLSFGTGTSGVEGSLFSAWGRSGADEAPPISYVGPKAGANLLDRADVQPKGHSRRSWTRLRRIR